MRARASMPPGCVGSEALSWPLGQPAQGLGTVQALSSALGARCRQSWGHQEVAPCAGSGFVSWAASRASWHADLGIVS